MLRCPRDISSYCDEILHLNLEYLSYDPNFTDNMEEDTDDETLEEEEDEYVFSLCEVKLDSQVDIRISNAVGFLIML